MTPHLLSNVGQAQTTSDLAYPSHAEIKFIEPMKILSTVFVKTSVLHQHRLFEPLFCLLKHGGITQSPFFGVKVVEGARHMSH